MKKLLFQLDTDAHPAVFDTVVAYDGGRRPVVQRRGLRDKAQARVWDWYDFIARPLALPSWKDSSAARIDS